MTFFAKTRFFRKVGAKFEYFGVADVVGRDVVGVLDGDGFFSVFNDRRSTRHEVAQLQNVTC